MTTKTLLSLATVSLLAFAAKADTTYIVDESVKWFDENIAGSSTAPTSDGEYDPTPTPTVAGTDGNYYIDLDTAANSPLFFTPSGQFSTLSGSTTYRFDVKIKNLIVNASVASLPTDAAGFGNVGVSPAVPYASIAAVDNVGNKWYGWDGDSWEQLTDITTVPAENSSYDVVIEFFVVSSQLKIKYTVGSQSHTLQHASANALPSLTKIGFAGCGQFQNFSGSGVKTTFSVETTKTEEQLKDAGLTVKAGQTVAQALNDTGANGLQQWQSLALGIDPTTTKPYTAPVQTGGDDAGMLGFAIGNYGTPSVTIPVSFTVYELDSLDDKSPTAKVTANAGQTALVEAPSEVKYYKIKVTFGQQAQQQEQE